MTEVWKSQGRKYCEFCDCWFADNKISTSFHENGKRHKESVEKKVKEIQKKGSEKEKKEKDEKRFLEMMEKGAAAAIEKDIKQDPRMINHYFGDDVEVPIPERSDDPPIQGPALPPTKKQRLTSSSSTSSSTSVKLKPDKVWHEALSPEGYSYYWNVETGQSVWVAPPGGYVPLSGQTEDGSLKPEANGSANAESNKVDKKKEKTAGGGLVHKKSWKERAYGGGGGGGGVVGGSGAAYGGWNSAAKSDSDKIDYQLPPSTVEVNLERDRIVAAATSAGEQEIVFQTKVVPSITPSSSSAPRTSGIVFKKRKSNPAGDRRLGTDT